MRTKPEKEVTPNVEEWEEAGTVPKSIWEKMGGQGFLGMDVPEKYGELGADFLYSVILTEELARSWRDTRVMSIFAGTNEIMKTIVAKMMGL